MTTHNHKAEFVPQIESALRSILPRKPAEAQFRSIIDPLLSDFCNQIGATPLGHVEYTLGTSRADTVFNRLVIEYKRPGVPKKSPDGATQAAIQQVKNYITDLAKKERRQLERLAGVVFDGHFLIFVRFTGGKWVEEPSV